jgi:hypothetical protein
MKTKKKTFKQWLSSFWKGLVKLFDHPEKPTQPPHHK